MNIPQKPRHGEPVVKGLLDAINRIIDFLPSLQVRGDSKTTRVIETPFGRTISVIDNNVGVSTGGQAQEQCCTPAIISSYNDEDGYYNIKLYKNGFDKDSTGEGILEVLNLVDTDILPNGTKIIAHYAHKVDVIMMEE